MPGDTRCERWEDCQRRDEETRRMIDQIRNEKREDHKEMWDAIHATNESISALAVTVGSLTGKFVGYMAAGTLLIGVVSFLAAKIVGGVP